MNHALISLHEERRALLEQLNELLNMPASLTNARLLMQTQRELSETSAAIWLLSDAEDTAVAA